MICIPLARIHGQRRLNFVAAFALLFNFSRSAYSDSYGSSVTTVSARIWKAQVLFAQPSLVFLPITVLYVTGSPSLAFRSPRIHGLLFSRLGGGGKKTAPRYACTKAVGEKSLTLSERRLSLFLSLGSRGRNREGRGWI